MEDLVKKIEKKTKIKTYPAQIRKVLSALLSTKDFWKVVDLSGIVLPQVAGIIEVLKEENYVTIEKKKIKLTEKGKKLIKKEKISKKRNYKCECCEGRGVDILYRDLKRIYDRYKQIVKERPDAIAEYDQGFITPESVVARIGFALQKGDIAGKKIIILGDDDLLSIGISLTNLAEKITVLEIDERLIEFIKNKSKKYKLNIDAKLFDLREKLPDDIVGKYDTFFCDPSETPAAFKAFIAKGIATLNEPGSAGYFGITTAEASPLKWWKMEKFLISLKTVITDILPEFSEYELWNFTQDTRAYNIAPVKTLPTDIWYRSSFFRIETLPGFKRLNKKISDKVFYQDIESSCQ